jgi:release factor glutamine methyltransferase
MMSAAASRQGETWTTRKLLAWMGEAFARKGLDSPRLQAEMLLAHVIGCDRLRLYTDPDRPASPLERQTLRELVARALGHEPIQYLVGEAWFFGLPFKVDRRVLIPRPSTETIVEHVLRHARTTPGFGGRTGEGVLLADVCTGSGCIAIAILKNLPAARAIGTDVSGDALAVARENAARHGVVDRLDLLEGDLLEPLQEFPATRAPGTLHYLVANPPYIPDHEWDAVEPNVRDHEPTLALRAGPDGLRCIRPIVEKGPRFLRAGGLMLIESAASTAEQVRLLVSSHPRLDDPTVLKDFEDLPRVVLARRRPS